MPRGYLCGSPSAFCAVRTALYKSHSCQQVDRKSWWAYRSQYNRHPKGVRPSDEQMRCYRDKLEWTGKADWCGILIKERSVADIVGGKKGIIQGSPPNKKNGALVGCSVTPEQNYCCPLNPCWVWRDFLCAGLPWPPCCLLEAAVILHSITDKRG